jgi:general stress protein YciG
MKNKRGFAVMDKDRVREIARAGGKRAHQMGTAHEFNSETARAAGLKGRGIKKKKYGKRI